MASVASSPGVKGDRRIMVLFISSMSTASSCHFPEDPGLAAAAPGLAPPASWADPGSAACGVAGKQMGEAERKAGLDWWYGLRLTSVIRR